MWCSESNAASHVIMTSAKPSANLKRRKPQEASVLLQPSTSATIFLGSTAKDFVDTLCQQMLGTGKGISACARRQLYIYCSLFAGSVAFCSKQADTLCQGCYTTSRIQTVTDFHALTALVCCRCTTTAISMQWIQHSSCGALHSIPWEQSSVMGDNMMLRSWCRWCKEVDV